MSLVEYKSPVLKKPKFGWQRYQFGNKTAAELKTSLWDANLSEVIIDNTVSSPIFPITGHVDVFLFHDSGGDGLIQYGTKSIKMAKPIEDIYELVGYLNKVHPFLGEFRPNDKLDNVVLVVDKTLANATYNNSGNLWDLQVTPL